MSGWRRAADDDGDEDDRALVSEDLVRDDGRVLGGIVRFYREGPTYAWSQYGRIGPCSPLLPGGAEVTGWVCDRAARAAVEAALEAGGAGRRPAPETPPGVAPLFNDGAPRRVGGPTATT